MMLRTALVLALLTVSRSSAQGTQPDAGAPDGDVTKCPQSLIAGAATYHSTVGHFGRKCYTIETATKATWDSAEAACATFGGSLVHIESSNEQAFVAGFVARHSGDAPVWIGLHDRFFEGTYMWVNGGPLASVTYTHFDPNHLSTGTNDVDDCVVMKPDGFWDDVQCGYKDFTGDHGEMHPVMCQYDLVLGVLGVIGK